MHINFLFFTQKLNVIVEKVQFIVEIRILVFLF